MKQHQFEDLDRFLTVAELTGTRFGVRDLAHCSLGAWAQERGLLTPEDIRRLNGLAYSRLLHTLGTSTTRLAPVWEANDASDGDPTAIRRALHLAYPEFAVVAEGALT